ncbi:MAG: sigma-54-dependent Fis family transcriptional regulator [bacterium]|nr:sigma-54-dependent Fis family transcriptional regulator [bacterium]
MTRQKSIRVLLMDGERPLKLLLERDLTERRPTVIAVQSGEEARELANRQLDTSRLDFQVPGVGRVETRNRQRGGDGSDMVVLDSQDGEVPPLDSPAAVAASYLDSVDAEFLTRPLKASDVGALVREAKQRQQQAPEPVTLTVRTASGHPFVVYSPKMVELMAIVDRVAAGSASILIQGQTGTGKTLIAREIHASSPRAEESFVAINCSAFQEQLLESEVFGHEKGSFTGAIAAKPGLFEVAHKGTLFLDEVGDMSSAMQAKLLQVLDDGELRRVGGTKNRKVDVRVIAASNKNLKEEVKAKRFREDLLFRLNVIQLRVPRLSERREDIPPLIAHFLERFRLPGQPRKSISPEATQLLMSYNWPGNVRELANAVEGLILLAPGEIIRAEDLPPNLRPAVVLNLGDSDTPLPMSEIERLHIITTMRFTEGKKAPAARLLGIDVKTLSNKIKNYKIEL